MRNIILTILLLAVIFAIYLYAMPAWNSIQRNREAFAMASGVLKKVDKFNEVRDLALERLNDVTPNQRSRIDLMLPKNTNREDMYLFFQNLIVQSGMDFSGVTLSDKGGDERRMTFTFEVTGSYGQLRVLLDGLENNIRIMDVKNISLDRAPEGAGLNINISGDLYYGG